MQKSKLKIALFRDTSQEGIWQFSSYLSPVSDKFKISLGEGGTEEISFREVVLKREDKNPTGSLKDRGMAYLISQNHSEGVKSLVLSSSGNAAISAASYCQLAEIELFVFVSPKINRNKLEIIREAGAKIFLSERAVSEAIKFAKDKGFSNLRPSENRFGPEGFQTIAFELALNQGYVEDLFLPVSSGVTLKGVSEGFKKLGLTPRLHACQSTAVCPIASAFDKEFVQEKESLADSLVAKFTPLKSEIIKILQESGGGGWVISNQEIIEAQDKLEKEGIETSPEGALALAAFFKAQNKGWKLGKAACLLTGRKH